MALSQERQAFKMNITSFIIGWVLGVVSMSIYTGRQRRDAKHRKAWKKIRNASKN